MVKKLITNSAFIKLNNKITVPRDSSNSFETTYKYAARVFEN